MLSLLHIENIALIDQADISFGSGFNVLTGETGAGKSIIIDAISAVLGERTSRDLIRTGEKSALVTALFRDLPSLPWFQETGIGPDENGELLISRRIQGDGKNICRVGGVPCTVVQLRTLGSQLIDIHGQHDGQQLLDESCHLAYLDSFGELEPALSAYREEYAKLDALRKQIASLQMDETEKARRLDILQFQIDELESAHLRLGEEEELDEDTVMMDALEAGADDMVNEGDVFVIYTDPDALSEVVDALEAKGYTFTSAEVAMVPQNTIKLTDEGDIKNMEKMIDMLEADDDVQNVWHNWEQE